MHYAAELGFLQVTKTLVKKCPLLLALKTKDQQKPVEKRAMLPVELAIAAENDDVAAFLIRVMWHERYRINLCLLTYKLINISTILLSVFVATPFSDNAKGCIISKTRKKNVRQLHDFAITNLSFYGFIDTRGRHFYLVSCKTTQQGVYTIQNLICIFLNKLIKRYRDYAWSHTCEEHFNFLNLKSAISWILWKKILLLN